MASGARRKIESKPMMSDEEYLAFIKPRPSEERWQLIDGVAMLMPPPTIRHQRVASNLARLLNDHFDLHRPELYAYQEIGLIVPTVQRFRPEADVAVLDNAADLDTSWADRFYFVAEVLSESNTDSDVEIKRERYIVHPDNHYCLIIDQKRIYVEVWARADGWRRAVLDRADETLSLPAFGLVTSLSAIYRGTGVTG